MADAGKERNLLNAEALPTLMLIHDDQISREVIATVLTMSGYSVHAAADGAEALQLLEAGASAPDAILMDAQMPGLSGTHLIDELRARSRAGIYVISASRASPEVLAIADGFLLKPFDVMELQELLAKRHECVAPLLASARLDDQQLGDEPVVDVVVLAQLRAMMPEAAVNQIYAAIVADLDLRRIAIEAAFAQGDMAQIRRIGHAIKGGCAIAGARQAMRLGALLESGLLESELLRSGLLQSGLLKSGGNQMDNISSVLCDLRMVASNLERMLSDEFNR
jgi:CheY-like chemotaxis protein